MPLAPRLFSFPFFSTAPSLFLSLFPGKLRGNRQILGSEPSLRLLGPKSAKFRPNANRQNTGNLPGILQRTRVYLEITLRPPGYFVDFLNFASDFAPDQLSDSGKLAIFPRETREKQNGAPNTLCFPWKFPETQSAGDPLFSFLFSGKLCSAQGSCREEGGVSRKAREAARARQTAAASQNEAEESDESEDETAGERTRTRVRRTRGGS